MGRLYRLRWLLFPSILSGICSILITTTLLINAGWSYISDTRLFYDALFGANGVVTIVQIYPGAPGNIWYAISNGPATYYVLLVVASIIAGLTVFLVLQSISFFFRGASLFLAEIHDNKETARKAARESLIRLGLHSLGIAAWGVYALVFVNVIVPFAIALLQQSLDGMVSSPLTCIGLIALDFAVLLLAIHLHATFARLSFLRIRLFGGADAQLAAVEADTHTLPQ